MTTAQDAVSTPATDQNPLAQNPLLSADFLIPFDRIRPEHAAPATESLIAQARADLEELAASGDQPGFLERLDTFTAQLDTAVSVVFHLEGVVESDGWRAARQTIQPLFSAFYTDCSMHAGLYAALKA